VSAPTPHISAAGWGDWKRVFGTVASVDGTVIQVNGPNAPVTVFIMPATKIAAMTAGTRGDLVPGACMWIHATKKPTGTAPPTALQLVVGADFDSCAQVHPTHSIYGTLASVNGDTVVVASSDSPSTSVTVTPATKYVKLALTDESAITPGLCLIAQGMDDGTGAVQAATISVHPADPNHGDCSGDR
jgi:hypothetical protein